MWRREYSVPERLALFGYLVGGAAIVYPALSQATGLGVPCLLRSTTGIPCPACGMTTAATALVAGHPDLAWQANPAIFALAGLALVMAPVLVSRTRGWSPAPRAASNRTRRQIGRLAVVGAFVSWLVQLHRFEFI